MKKTLLAILLALVLCLTVVVAVACDPKDGGEGGDDKLPEGLPTADGKVTFYAEIAYDVPEYGSPFMAGSIEGWGTGWEMTRLGTTQIWYVQKDAAEIDPYIGQTVGSDPWNEYKMTLGYNAASGLPQDKQGNKWTCESDKNQGLGTNSSFEYKKGQKAVNLGKFTFDIKGGGLTAPRVLTKTTLRVYIEQELGDNAEVQIRGGFNNWGNDNIEDAIATQSSTNKHIWTLEITEVLAMDYEYKILICQDTTQIADPSVGAWDAVDGDGNKAYIQVCFKGGNLSIELRAMHENEYAELAGTITDPDEDEVITGLDLDKAENGQLDLYNGVEITLTVKFAAALAEGLNVFAIGGHAVLGNWTEADAVKFETEDRITWTATIEIDKSQLGETIGEFKIGVVEGDEFGWGAGTNYGMKEGVVSTAPDAGNFTAGALAESVELVSEALVYPPVQAEPAE